MKELTKEERHAIYVKMLEYFKNPTKSLDQGEYGKYKLWLCYVLHFYTDTNYSVHIWQLPELMKHNPNQGFGFWFPLNEEGYAKRLEIIEKAIEETKPVTK